MTGLEAWHLVAPLIAGEFSNTETGMKAYVLIYTALKEHDERKEEE